MDIAIIIVITAAVAIYIALPFFFRRDEQATEDEVVSTNNSEDPIGDNLKHLENRKETLYSAIMDIEFDYGLGKLSKEDFEELDSKYKLEAATVLKQIDQIDKQVNIQEPDFDLEQEILSYRTGAPTNKSQSEDAQIEKEVSAFRSANQSNPKSYSCTKCGAKYSAGDMFCSKCGDKLN